MLKPALAAAIGTGLVRRKLMYSLIWQSVTWRPGTGGPPCVERVQSHAQPAATASGTPWQKGDRLRGPAARATPSRRRHGGDSHTDRRAFSSCLPCYSWTRNGVFARIFAALAEAAGPPERIIIDSTHLKAHRTAASLLQKKGGRDRSGAPKAG